ncbi:tetratricopeptide repeat protein [Acrocarpospora catenulata]|uniref:tetratricopeptide repeat protein n=1 Tax=Acrocarpospora catenulata TaxID=2836182 RepID=UPI001BDB0638|nr:tetratricopeptide repeat protein [Acrocarpospora catenulata]
MMRVVGTGALLAVVLAMLGPAGSGGSALPPVDRLAETAAYLRAHPGDGRMWAALGDLYAERVRRTGDAGLAPRAEEAFRHALGLDSGNIDALVGLGALANTRHEFADGYAWATKALHLDPGRASAYGVLFDAAVELGRYGRAERALGHMLDLRADVASFTRAARMYELRGEHTRAEEALRRALDAAVDLGDLAYCHHRLGESRWAAGDVPGALREYQLALNADPLYAHALAGRGKAQAALGDVEAALGSYEAAVNRLPSPTFLLEEGELLLRIGRHREAETRFAMLRAAGDALTLGRYEADHGDPVAAVLLLRGEWRKRRSVEVADALGWALRRAGQASEAGRYARLAGRLGGQTRHST